MYAHVTASTSNDPYGIIGSEKLARAQFVLGQPLDIDGTRFQDKSDRTEAQEQYLLEFSR